MDTHPQKGHGAGNTVRTIREGAKQNISNTLVMLTPYNLFDSVPSK
jgi:hypothetical protein